MFNKNSTNQTTPAKVTAPSPTNAPTVQPTSEAMEKPDAMSDAKEFTIVGTPFTFSPKEIRVKKGDKVRIAFEVKQGTHDFVVDEFSIRTKVLNKGEKEAVEFTADKTGSFEYYCSVGNHRQMGMVGSLVVE